MGEKNSKVMEVMGKDMENIGKKRYKWDYLLARIWEVLKRKVNGEVMGRIWEVLERKNM